jgi:hypothetical protein
MLIVWNYQYATKVKKTQINIKEKMNYIGMNIMNRIVTVDLGINNLSVTQNNSSKVSSKIK